MVLYKNLKIQCHYRSLALILYWKPIYQNYLSNCFFYFCSHWRIHVVVHTCAFKLKITSYIVLGEIITFKSVLLLEESNHLAWDTPRTMDYFKFSVTANYLVYDHNRYAKTKKLGTCMTCTHEEHILFWNKSVSFVSPNGRTEWSNVK